MSGRCAIVLRLHSSQTSRKKTAISSVDDSKLDFKVNAGKPRLFDQIRPWKQSLANVCPSPRDDLSSGETNTFNFHNDTVGTD